MHQWQHSEQNRYRIDNFGPPSRISVPMSSTSRTQSRRRGRLSQGGSHPDAVTDISQSAERGDSRADVANLANAVASLTSKWLTCRPWWWP
ncbi:hypothetical protein M513_05232 [Trichuris suis]|uniref:Uncharacterized protein n=1 Tax=Trichuris suis TaxID=68888 RepID=A0A085M9R9_9BILA|nr:hypothetical protein M513_05232 [Trichuris suis]